VLGSIVSASQAVSRQPRRVIEPRPGSLAIEQVDQADRVPWSIEGRADRHAMDPPIDQERRAMPTLVVDAGDCHRGTDRRDDRAGDALELDGGHAATRIDCMS
jgi:hypothetical protein